MSTHSKNTISGFRQENKVSEEMLTHCQRIFDKDKNIEDVLMYLRKHGYSKGWAILVLFEILDMEFREIQDLVHFSTTWADVRERDEEFFTDMVNSLDKAYEESDEEDSSA